MEMYDPERDAPYAGQVIGELGPSPGALAGNSRAAVARRALELATQPIRTYMADTDLMQIRIERDDLRASNDYFRRENFTLQENVRTLYEQLYRRGMEIHDYGIRKVIFRRDFTELENRLRFWRTTAMILCLLAVVFAYGLIH